MTTRDFSDFILLPLGIILVLFTMLSFVLPYGRRFRENPQRLKGFGVELEVSFLVLIFVVGVGLCAVGFYWRTKDFEARIDSLSAAANSATLVAQALERVPRQVIPVVTLEGVGGAAGMPRLSDVRAQVFFGIDEARDVDVIPGLGENQFRLILNDMTPTFVVDSLALVDRATGRRWSYNERFSPALTRYPLKRRSP